MHPQSTISHYTKSTYFPLFEEPTAIINVLDELVPVQPQVYGYQSVFESTTGVVFSTDDMPAGWIHKEIAKHPALPASELVSFQRSYRSAVRDVLLSSYMLEPYRIQELTIKRTTDFFDTLLAIKDSEIRKLRNELSELKKESLQLNSELEQIKAECRQGILGIPEVQQALCEYNQREILFIFVLDDMTRDLSDQLGEVEYTLRKKYAAWNIGFEYVEDRISSQQFEESQVEIFDRD